MGHKAEEKLILVFGVLQQNTVDQIALMKYTSKL